jgi:hypothetical protein
MSLYIRKPVSARAVSGSEYHDGTIVAIHPTQKGNFYEIKRKDGAGNFKTRGACIRPRGAK